MLLSNDLFFIGIGFGMWIRNNRNDSDCVLLNSQEWSGVKQGIDGYPTKSGCCYHIGGG